MDSLQRSSSSRSRIGPKLNLKSFTLLVSVWSCVISSFVEGKKQNFYEILGVSKKANDREIQKAYRKKALKWHPDKIDSSQSEKQKKRASERFMELNNAYETLSDPEKRKNYDQYGEDPQRPGQAAEGHSGGFADPMDIFAQFFGGGGGFKGNSGHAKRTQGQKAEPQKPLYDDEEDVTEIQGLEDYNKVLENAKDHYEDQFVIKFYSESSKPSKELKPGFLKLARMYNNAVNFYGVSCNRHKKICDKNDVSTYPTIKFVGAKGSQSFEGTANQSNLQKWIASTMPDRTRTLNTIANLDKFLSEDSAKVVLFVEKPSTPPRMKLLSMKYGKLLIGIVSKRDTAIFKTFNVPKKQALPCFQNVLTGEFEKIAGDDIPEYFQGVLKTYRDDQKTAKFEELTDTLYKKKGYCNAADSKYCVLVVGTGLQTDEAKRALYLEVSQQLKDDPVRLLSISPQQNSSMTRKLLPLLQKIKNDPTVILWRPKRRRWKQLEAKSGLTHKNTTKNQKIIVDFVRGAIDSGGMLENRHDEL